MTDTWDGRPQMPECDGHHWLKDRHDGKETVWQWSPIPEGKDGPDLWISPYGGIMRAPPVGRSNIYLGPAMMPAEVAARVAAAVMAEREACAAICGDVARERWAAEKRRPVSEPLFLWLGGPDSECGRRIQQRPVPSALAVETKP